MGLWECDSFDVASKGGSGRCGGDCVPSVVNDGEFSIGGSVANGDSIPKSNSDAIRYGVSHELAYSSASGD